MDESHNAESQCVSRLTNASECVQMRSNAYKCVRVSSRGMRSNAFKCVRMRSNAFECVRMHLTMITFEPSASSNMSQMAAMPSTVYVLSSSISSKVAGKGLALMKFNRSERFSSFGADLIASFPTLFRYLAWFWYASRAATPSTPVSSSPELGRAPAWRASC
jgi:hypothetical protein